MKELSIEEKAKAYDKALAKARNIVNSINVGLIGKDSFEAVFPELKESEDERTRNELIAFIEQAIHRGGGTPIPKEKEDKWLAYLEKQKETLHIQETCKENADSFTDDEDERIRKAIINLVETEFGDRFPFDGFTREQMLAWLEKQGEQKCTAEEVLIKAGLKPYKDGDQWCILLGDNIQEGICGFGNTIDDALYAFLNDLIKSQKEQKPVDKVEPKFHEGEWIVRDLDNTCYQIKKCILNVTNNKYGYDLTSGGYISSQDANFYHRWTIQDAKEGDVLIDLCDDYKNPLIFILKKFEKVDFGLAQKSDYSSYCFLSMSDNPRFKEGYFHHIHNIKPATQEQRDLLLRKMKVAGYEWDAEKKELKKIEQKPSWSEEDEKFFKTALWHISYSISNGKSTNIRCDTTEWLKSLKERVQPQPKQEWSEEDEEIIHVLTRNLDACENGNAICFNPSDCRRYSNWLKSLRPQPKQEWSEEDETVLNNLIYALANDRIGNNRDEYVKWLKSLHPQQKPKWSEKDDSMLNSILEVFYTQVFCCDNENYRQVDWLKSLRQQPKQEWSEEDENVINNACAILTRYGNIVGDEQRANEIYKTADRLKSIRPQSHWKPSEEQIAALRHASNDCSIAFADMKILATLYEQLKALHRYEQDT